MLSTAQSFEMFPKHNGVATISESENTFQCYLFPKIS